MGEFKYKALQQTELPSSRTETQMRVSRSRYLPSKFLEFPEVPLSVNTLKRSLTSFFPNRLFRWFMTLVRFVQVFFSAAIFALGSLWNFIWYLFNPDRREKANAVLFVQRFKNLGGAFVKIGQQLALRRDILPDAFCEELEDLHDKANAFRFSHTERLLKEAINQENTGRRTKRRTRQKELSEVFAHIKKEPIGKASIACVYKAELIDGSKVAIKVKRPNIERTFAADIFALSLFLDILEFFNIMKTGITSNLQSEVREMFTEELNFNIEKRYQDLFRKIMKKNRRYKVTAPKIYFKLSSEKVIVSEFLEKGVDGIFMTDFDRVKKEEGEEAAYALLDKYGINPKKVAKRLIQINYFSFYEMPFFHGDPHPGNVFLKPNNEIVLIDFGSCGSFGEKERNLMRMMQFYYQKGDVSGMTQSVVNLMEPLPPIDVHAFTKELEAEWWQGYYGILSKNAHWTEKTSFRLWLALFNISNKHNVPVPLHMLRMVRATLAYDTVAAGLYPQLNVFKEYKKYFEAYARRVRCEVKGDLMRQLFFGPDAENFVRLKRLFELGEEAVFRFQQLIRTPVPNFASISDKVFDLVRFFFQYLKRVALILVVSMSLIYVSIRNTNTDGLNGRKFLKSHWDEVVVGAFSLNNWVNDFGFTNDVILERPVFRKPKTLGDKLGAAAKWIDRIMMINVILVIILTWIYLQKILSRFKDADTRN